MKTPDTFKIRDWQHYVFAAVRRETGKQWQPKSHTMASWTKCLKDLLKNEVDCFMLALGLDLLALSWDPWRSPWEQLATGSLFRPFRLQARSLSFWKAVWFSRYASGEHEVQYYRYHLTQYDAALSLPQGEPGRQTALRSSKKALAEAERTLVIRNNQPAFEIHWLRDRMGDVL